jgi:hypothetical protein
MGSHPMLHSAGRIDRGQDPDKSEAAHAAHVLMSLFSIPPVAMRWIERGHHSHHVASFPMSNLHLSPAR